MGFEKSVRVKGFGISTNWITQCTRVAYFRRIKSYLTLVTRLFGVHNAMRSRFDVSDLLFQFAYPLIRPIMLYQLFVVLLYIYCKEHRLRTVNCCLDQYARTVQRFRKSSAATISL